MFRIPLFFLILSIITTWPVSSFFFKSEKTPQQVRPIADSANYLSGNSDTVTIIGVGDMMLGTLYPAGFLPPNDGKELLEPVKNILQDADLTFGNCEGTFLDAETAGKKCDNPSLCYSFRQPERYVDYYAKAGFDVLSIANNHVGDFGETGRNRTVAALQKAKLHFAGLLSCPFTIFEMQDVKYGFCAFAPNDGTVDIRDIEGAKKIVSYLDSLCDIVIVSFHGGAEGSSHQHVTRQTEMFHGENRGNVYVFSHAMIDAGADIIFGHGPHVTRAVDLYKDRFIIYSMGNFATYARFNLKGANGIAPIVKVFTNKKGKFLKAKIFPVKQVGEGGPFPDSTNAIVKTLISLTATDFPESTLNISDQGVIVKK